MRTDQILDFLTAVDQELTRHAEEGETLDLYLIGRSALILRLGLDLMTKDVDVVYLHGSELQGKAEEHFGKGTPGAERWGFYLEAVSSGLPPIPAGYQGRSENVPGAWKILRPKQLEIHDLAVTRLKRFHPKDRNDLRILCETGRLHADGLRRALDLAFAFAADEEEDPGRKTASANLRVVIDYLEGRRRELG
jgi:hypothetical protein